MSTTASRLSVPARPGRQGRGWFLVAAAYVVVMALSASVLSWDIWAALVIAPILFTLTVPIVRRGLREELGRRAAARAGQFDLVHAVRRAEAIYAAVAP